MSEDVGVPGPIIHMRADSDSTLDDLFDVALKPPGSHLPLQVPLRMRNLPESFFRQPLHHSREGSLTEEERLSGGGGGGRGVGPSYPIQHSRAHSSPATLQQTLAVAGGSVGPPSGTPVGNHARQQSYDPSGELSPLPPGWEMAKTPGGQIYFMNHISKTTQWEDPRKQQQQPPTQQTLFNPTSFSRPANASSSPSSSSSPCHSPAAAVAAVSGATPLGSLPPGWDQGETPEGEVYYINHATKKTTWFDPRLPNTQQRIPSQKDASRVSRLQRLENERRALQMRQAELKKYMEKTEALKLMKRQSQQDACLQQTQDMLMRQNLNAGDETVSRSDIHNRQESADSGLGMGSNFNLGSIPEDISGMEMDTADLDTTLTEQRSNGPPSTNTTSNNNGTSQQPNGNTNNSNVMDSDTLIPSLTGDLGDELSNDIMQDVQSILCTNKGDNLTWL